MGVKSAKALLLAGSLSVSMILVEVVLRMVFGTPVHFRYPQERYIAEAVIGRWLEPGQSSFTHHQPVETNSVGLRDDDYPREVSEGHYRVIALGDSQTFGDGLAGPETWPKQLEVALAGRVEVLNAGLSGTDTWQHAHVLKRLGESYEYDAVLLAFYVNDVTPRYEPRLGGRITNTWQKRLGYILKRSGLFTLLWQRYQSVFTSVFVTERERRILTGDSDEILELGWQQVESSLAEMSVDLSARGIPFAVMVLPRRDQVSDADPPRSYNERIEAIAARLEIPTLDLLDGLRSAYATHGQALFIPWDGHNSALTNGLIADWVARDFPRLFPTAGLDSAKAKESAPASSAPR